MITATDCRRFARMSRRLQALIGHRNTIARDTFGKPVCYRRQMRAFLLICMLSAVAGCQATARSDPTPQQIADLPPNVRLEHPRIIDSRRFYDHFGAFRGWTAFEPAAPMAHPGFCLVHRLGISPDGEVTRVESPESARWIALADPLTGASQARACAEIQTPSRNLAALSEEEAVQAVQHLRRLRREITTPEAAAALITCSSMACADPFKAIKPLSPRMMMTARHSEPSRNHPYEYFIIEFYEPSDPESHSLTVAAYGRHMLTMILPVDVTPERRVVINRFPQL